MTTLAVMKARITDELARADLTPMIAYAISDAIAAYQSRRFFFNESRDLIELTTTADQEWYDKYDDAAIPDLYSIDYIKIEIGDNVYDLRRCEPSELESVISSSGQPNAYTYFNQSIRLYPTPDAAYDLLISGHIKVDEPASDTETNNPWMTYAERLIRWRAKLELALNVNASGVDPSFSPQAVMLFKQKEDEAFNELKARTAKQLGTGKVKPYR